MTGGSAETQGNETLIPTPPLPSCASAICGVEPLPGPKTLSASSDRRSAARDKPGRPTGPRLRIIDGPEAELATKYLTVIRWRTINPGGSPVHFGIVRYGTRSNHLNEIAQSPIRLNPNHPTTLFRVRLEHLQGRTTYYYKVESISANGGDDRVGSRVKTFATR